MDDLNTILSPDASVVMRAVWESLGWVTIDDILEKIWQDGFSKDKVRRILRELNQINFVSIKKRGSRNYYAQRIGISQYYPDLHETPENFIEHETIKLHGTDTIRKMRELRQMADGLKKPQK